MLVPLAAWYAGKRVALASKGKQAAVHGSPEQCLGVRAQIARANGAHGLRRAWLVWGRRSCPPPKPLLAPELLHALLVGALLLLEIHYGTCVGEDRRGFLTLKAA